ncbi:MAG: ArsR/SmtB family transcription factor [Desulfopila sp.]
MNKELCGVRVIHQDLVARARSEALADNEVEGLTGLFKAFADPSRLRILQALRAREMCVCDLAALLKVSESAVSHQLRMLRHLQLVANRREGTILYYRLRDEHVGVLLAVALEHLQEDR